MVNVRPIQDWNHTFALHRHKKSILFAKFKKTETISPKTTFNQCDFVDTLHEASAILRYRFNAANDRAGVMIHAIIMKV